MQLLFAMCSSLLPSDVKRSRFLPLLIIFVVIVEVASFKLFLSEYKTNALQRCIQAGLAMRAPFFTAQAVCISALYDCASAVYIVLWLQRWSKEALGLIASGSGLITDVARVIQRTFPLPLSLFFWPSSSQPALELYCDKIALFHCAWIHACCSPCTFIFLLTGYAEQSAFDLFRELTLSANQVSKDTLFCLPLSCCCA